MVAGNLSCPKCQGRMETGFLPDRGYGAVFVGSWQAGAPDRGWFGLKWRGKTQYEITAYRCSACGYLEHYANP